MPQKKNLLLSIISATRDPPNLREKKIGTELGCAFHPQRWSPNKTGPLFFIAPIKLLAKGVLWFLYGNPGPGVLGHP